MRTFRREVRVDGLPVPYQVAGEGEPIVLLHGFATSSRCWTRNVPTLAEHHTVYLLDLPAFGSLSQSKRPFTLAEATDWLLSWMNAAKLEDAYLVGHSMGGLLGLRLAVRHPDRIARLVLAAPAIRLAGSTLLGNLLPAVRSWRHGNPHLRLIAALDSLRAGPIWLLRAASQLVAATQGEPEFPMDTPTLLICGSNDAIVPPRAAAALRDRLPSSRLLVIEGAGHVVMIDRPREFNTAVLKFISGIEVGV